MKRAQIIYLRFLSICYLVGSVLHLMDLFDLRLKFSEMSLIWKSWIIYLFIGDLVASIGLLKDKLYGVSFFFIVAFSQIIAYTAFVDYFSPQPFLIYFHFITISIYLILNFQGFIKYQGGTNK